jgi:hypothetical protein
VCVYVCVRVRSGTAGGDKPEGRILGKRGEVIPSPGGNKMRINLKSNFYAHSTLPVSESKELSRAQKRTEH